VERYSYDVFDEPNRTSDVNNPYMFTGRRYDPEAGLYYYRARYYDYYTGRFLQPDPIGYSAAMNLYTYCSGNPTSLTDPTGLVPKGAHPFAVLKLRPNAVLRVTTSDGKTKGYKVSTATDIVKVMIKSKVTDNPIVAFEYIGHGEVSGNGLGVGIKGGQLTGIYYISDDKSDNWLREMAQSEPDVYSMESLRGLIEEAFAPKAKVLLHACYTAGSVGKEFKRILPEAEVWGYTGIAKIDTLWGLAYAGEDSELIKIESPNQKECSK
jgi:RHS repeat-associated protein